MEAHTASLSSEQQDENAAQSSSNSLQSDLKLNASTFSDSAVSANTKKLNDTLIKIMDGQAMWWEVGAEKYRQMRRNNETPLPGPTVLESGTSFNLPSRDKGRDIPCRVFKPQHASKGVFMHVHGGGWVLSDHMSFDPLLKYVADTAQLTTISVGYRLAPEHPYPAGPEDCYDAAEWLIDNAKKEFGAELAFVGGESAGAHLSALTAFHLHDNRPSFALKGLVLHFGCYDLAGLLPHVHNFDRPLVLTLDIVNHFVDAFLPNRSIAERQDPAISPLFRDLRKMGSKLPPAFFTCGTEDALLDDTVFMSSKWMMAGGEAIVKFYPGAPHGYISFPFEQCKEAEKALADTKAFLTWKLDV